MKHKWNHPIYILTVLSIILGIALVVFIVLFCTKNNCPNNDWSSNVEMQCNASYRYNYLGNSSMLNLECKNLDQDYPEMTATSTGSSGNSKSALDAIPRFVFQGVRDTNNLSAKKQCGFLSVKKRMPEFEHFVYSNQEQREFVALYYPNMLSFFDGAVYDVERADLWRYLVIYHYGGVYLDADSIVIRGFDSWVSLDDSKYKQVHLVVGVAGNTVNGEYYTSLRRELMMSQFAAIPRHPFLGFLIERILSESKYSASKSDIVEFAGPVAFTDAMDEYLVRFNQSIDKVFNTGADMVVDDIYFVAINGFGCGQGHSNSKPCKNNPSALVSEGFEGTWK